MTQDWEWRACSVCGGLYPLIGYHSQGNGGGIYTSIRRRWICKLCRNSRSDRFKAKDRFLYVAKKRTQSHARKFGVTAGFLWNECGWSNLPELLAEAFPTECLGCDMPYADMPNGLNDCTIDMREPVRDERDRARMSVKNVQPLCTSCNRTKLRYTNAQWLDYLEYVRLWKEQRAKNAIEPFASGHLFIIDDDAA